MTARIVRREPPPRTIRSLGGNLFTCREDPALVAEVIAIKHRAAGETFNPRTRRWEAVRAS